MKSITVFTPTFNRAYCLDQLYQSLLRQTNKDFLWLIIDDGSTDNTSDLVSGWISENKFEIHYRFKNNGGMHTGYNLAYELITTELNVCIDSDDYMTDNAIELILNHWKNFGNKNYAGIIGLDCYKNGVVIGDEIPKDLFESTICEFNWVLGIKGDKKLVYRTDVMKQLPPYPTFHKEKFVPLDCKPVMADQYYKMLTLNKVLCVVEYMEDGSSKNIIKSYLNNPKGFAYSRKIRMQYSPSIKDKFRNAIHYVSSAIITKNFKFLLQSPRKILTFIAIPFGVLLFFYINFSKKSDGEANSKL
jgi:glycosyltransferase involved in cell wall biosynthesis